MPQCPTPLWKFHLLCPGFGRGGKDFHCVVILDDDDVVTALSIAKERARRYGLDPGRMKVVRAGEFRKGIVFATDGRHRAEAR